MHITILAGSNRKESTSTRLCEYIQRQMEAKGCTVELFDLYKKPLPFFNADNRNPDDANLQELKLTMLKTDAVVLSTPDYHGGMTGVLKNALDFLGFDHFDGKAVLSVSSSGGAVGVSPLQQLQVTVRNVHGINCPEWISIGAEFRQFDEEGAPANEKLKQRTLKTINYFIQMAAKLRA
ncbi:NADPH-dependent FMN reductase [Paenibacillus koleovorans]|uniref:NADPH-dependent FMN reductase n=1 Tax=Paenibacillus koleovorans TaxID=121608 RepID=UPI000FD73DB7|nr:NADPH-dependent FMN reductase [Paenibacillus koleovorans]